MRLSRDRSWPKHASIPEPVDPGMRLFRDAVGPSMRLSRDRLARACVYPGVGWPGHASIPGRLTRACVNSGVGWPKHASIPGSVGLSMRLFRGPVGPGMRLFRGRPAEACVYPGIGRPEHALDEERYAFRQPPAGGADWRSGVRVPASRKCEWRREFRPLRGRCRSEDRRSWALSGDGAGVNTGGPEPPPIDRLEGCP